MFNSQMIVLTTHNLKKRSTDQRSHVQEEFNGVVHSFT